VSDDHERCALPLPPPVVVAIVAGVAMLRRLMLPSPGLTAFLSVCVMLLIVVGPRSGQLSHRGRCSSYRPSPRSRSSRLDA
jgi:hypothetical protein